MPAFAAMRCGAAMRGHKVPALPGLGFVCYMWFDVWPLPHWARHIEAFRVALWHLLQQMLKMPVREVQFAALHGIGHEKDNLQRNKDIEDLLAAFAARVASVDPELSAYAQAAATGYVLY